MEGEIPVLREPYVSRKMKGALETKSNREALQTAEKLLEYARFKGMRSFRCYSRVKPASDRADFRWLTLPVS